MNTVPAHCRRFTPISWLRTSALGFTLLAMTATFAVAGWTPLHNTAPGGVGLMLLLPDGTVMAASVDADSNNNLVKSWYRLTPDSHGSYVNGEWTQLPNAIDSRLWYSAAVLRDGRVFVAGGEYGTGGSAAEIFDPVANSGAGSWTAAAAPGLFLSDSVSKLLPDGRVLVSPATGGFTRVYDPVADAWSAGPTPLNPSNQNEVTWLKLPDGSILTVPTDSQTSQRFIPAQNAWVADDDVPVSLYSSVGSEIGGALLLPNGDALYIGGNNNSALYTPSGNANPGEWRAGPTMPLIPDSTGPNPNMVPGCAPDAGCAMMVNGRVLCALSPQMYPNPAGNNPVNIFPNPTSFAIYDPVANTFTVIPGPTGGPVNGPSYQNIMLALPSGEVLYTSFSNQLYVYKPDEAPLPAGKPMITGLRPNADGSWHIEGAGFNGISEGASYGDDAQMDTNFPLVRFTSGDQVLYGRTFNRSSTGVALGKKITSTDFVPPAGLELSQAWSLQVVANGFVSDPVTFGGQPPIVTGITPEFGPKTGGTSITITGSHLAGIQLANLGTLPLENVQVVNDNTLTATTPASFNDNVGFVNMKLISTGGSTVVQDAFCYLHTGEPVTPTITSITPDHGPPAGGTTVTLTGTNFTVPTFVKLGSHEVLGANRIDSTTIQFTAPAHASGPVPVKVFTNGGGQASTTFTYDPPVAITTVSPSCGPPAGGTTVTIKGASFTNASAVTFDGLAAASFTVDNATTITATTPPHAKALVNVVVTTPIGSATGTSLFAYAEEVVRGSGWQDVSPADELGWSNAFCTADGSWISVVGDASAIWSSYDDGSHWTHTTALTSSIRAICRSANGTFLAAAMADGTIRTSMTSGTSWVSNNVGSTPVTNWHDITCSTDGSKLVAVQGGTGVGNVGSIWTSPDYGETWTERTAAGTRSWKFVHASANGQKLIAAEGNSLWQSADYGATWTANATLGAHFWQVGFISADGSRIAMGSAQGLGAGNSLWLSDDSGTTWTETTASERNWSQLCGSTDGSKLLAVCGEDQQLWISNDYGHTWSLVHEHPTDPWRSIACSANGELLMAIARPTSLNGIDSIWLSRSSYAPTVTAVSPQPGSTEGGTQVLITGTYFSAPAIVTFDGVPATDVSVVNSVNILAKTPPHAKGHVDVTVTTLAGCGTGAGAYIYGFAPEFKGITPPCGPVAGGTPVTITGKNFTGMTAVTFGGAAGTSLNVQSDTQLTVTTPAHPSGWVDIALTNGEGTSTAMSAFAFVKPPGSTDWISHPLAGTRGWMDIACSADGSKFVALDYGSETTVGRIWVSADYGETWQARGSLAHWTHCASSSDGTKLVAVSAALGNYDNPGATIVISDDSGQTWSTVAPFACHEWRAVACSGDGMKIVAIGATVPYDKWRVWMSSDRGQHWHESGLDLAHIFKDVAISEDGSTVIMAENAEETAPFAFDYGYIWTSTNFGNTWTAHTTPGRRQWTAVGASADGTKLFAGETGTLANAGGNMWRSTDSGATWSLVSGSPLGIWSDLDSSAAGDKLTTVIGGKAFPYSSNVWTDEGFGWDIAVESATFAQQDAPFFTQSCISSDGFHGGAAKYNEYLWTAETVVLPTITSITPNQGPVTGGTDVTITGTGFKSPCTVMFGGLAASNVVFVNGTTITATTPAHSSASVAVEVGTRNGVASSTFLYGTGSLVIEQPAGIVLNTGNVVGFGNADVGHAVAKNFRLRNQGNSTITGIALNISGTPGEFTVSAPETTSLPPGGTTTVTVTFVPSTFDARSAMLSVASAQSPTFQFTLTGSGYIPQPEIAVFEGIGVGGSQLTDNVGTVTYSATMLGGSKMRTFTIQNTGIDPLNNLALSITGDHPGDYSVSTLASSSLAPGATMTFTITFAPNFTGTLPAVVNIASTDADENPFRIAVSGFAMADHPLIAIQPTPSGAPINHDGTFAYPNTIKNNSLQRTFNLVSNNSTPITSLAMSKTGPNAARFTVSAIPTQLDPGTSAAFTITFAPDALQDFSCALEFTSIAATGPFVLHLTGTGIATPPPTYGIYSWGGGFLGQLGDGATNSHMSPAGVDITGVLAGKTLTAIAGGQFHTLAMSSDGKLYAWGANFSGQLGNGNTISSNAAIATDMTGALAGKTVAAIAAAANQSFALTTEGRVYAWGFGGSGQLGTGTFSGSTTPVEIDMSGVLAGKTITQIAAGSNHAIVIANDGQAYAWGTNGSGQIGHGFSFFYQPYAAAVSTAGVLAGKTVTHVAAGFDHSLAVTSDGQVFAWGAGTAGALGNGSTTDTNVPVAVDMTGALLGKTVTKVACGNGHSIALTSEGKVYAWGSNSNGQLGDGTTTTHTTPVAVVMTGALAGKTVKDIRAANHQTFALTTDGLVFAWGSNANGVLGDGTDVDRPTPVAVSTSGALAGKVIGSIGAGEFHALALEYAPPPPSPLETWRQQHFPGSTASTGPGADTATPQNDGISNLMKFALGMDPSTPGTLPISTGTTPGEGEIGPKLTLTYTPSVEAVAAGVIFRVEFSPSLLPGSWTSEMVNQGFIGSGGSPVTASVPKPESDEGFLRLSVTAP